MKNNDELKITVEKVKRVAGMCSAYETVMKIAFPEAFEEKESPAKLVKKRLIELCRVIEDPSKIKLGDIATCLTGYNNNGIYPILYHPEYVGQGFFLPTNLSWKIIHNISYGPCLVFDDIKK